MSTVSGMAVDMKAIGLGLMDVTLDPPFGSGRTTAGHGHDPRAASVAIASLGMVTVNSV